MRPVLLFVGLLALWSHAAQALDYPGTCRGPSSVVTSISGQDTRFATVTARLSRIDAEQLCKGEYAVGASMQRCIKSSMSIIYSAQANCFSGTLTTAASNLPKPDYPKSTWKQTYQTPIEPTCAGDNIQAIGILRLLCPAFRGEVEAR